MSGMCAASNVRRKSTLEKTTVDKSGLSSLRRLFAFLRVDQRVMGMFQQLSANAIRRGQVTVSRNRIFQNLLCVENFTIAVPSPCLRAKQ